MKIYVSGPISGIENRNIDAFNAMGEKLRSLGHEVINPFELDTPGFNPEGCWFKYLKRDLAQLLYCDAVCLLPGWEESKGARLEVVVARNLELPLYRMQNDKLIEELVAVDVDVVPMFPSHIWEE